MVEILEDGMKYSEIDYQKHTDSYEPVCQFVCLNSGQKAYNEFHNVV